MKQLVFISGKGGTGKSTLVSSLAKTAENKMLADCDVDAPNLNILLKGKTVLKKDYFGAKEAVIDKTKCIKCGKCINVCRFDAIGENYKIKPFYCEGCGSCVLVCPVNAVKLRQTKTGGIFVSKAKEGVFSHALLDIGAEGSGKLVTEVRKTALARKNGEDWLLIDGSPGIGCVVIASVTGADALVAVTEPTKSGLSDLKRVLKVAEFFKVPSYVCINKYDLNVDLTREIENYCRQNGYEIIGRIPFEPKIVKALREFKTPVEADLKNVSREIEKIWQNLSAVKNNE